MTFIASAHKFRSYFQIKLIKQEHNSKNIQFELIYNVFKKEITKNGCKFQNCLGIEQ